MSSPKTLVAEATAELVAARHNLNEVVETLQRIEQDLRKATSTLSAAQMRVRQGEARLRSAEAALSETGGGVTRRFGLALAATRGSTQRQQ